MRAWQKILLAYGCASASTVGPGWVTAELLRAWQVWPNLAPWHAVGALWLLVVGTPSMAWASGYLSKALGVPEPVTVHVKNLRRIPILSDLPVFADVLALAAPLRLSRHTPTIDFADRLAFQLGATVISERTLRHFLARSWVRQQQGEDGLSRSFWVDSGRIERSEYNAVVAALVAHKAVGGRRQGASGRLLDPPDVLLGGLRSLYGL
jgi:hypothetical protein